MRETEELAKDFFSNCKICKSDLKKIFTAVVLHKYEVDYFQCDNCKFIQTQKPFWLSEAYSSAIASLDVGLVNRNMVFSEVTEKIIKQSFNYQDIFLDYAGGYGLFVRLMRDKGFNFYRQDIYCQNLFAKYFDIEDLNNIRKFELVTAFEVFEHLTDPLSEIGKLFKYADSIFFSTEIVPENELNSSADWWYCVPETGQHISFYSRKALEVIADIFNCNFYTNGHSLHLFTKKNLEQDPFFSAPLQSHTNLVSKIFTRLGEMSDNSEKNTSELPVLVSLLRSDFEMIKRNMHQ